MQFPEYLDSSSLGTAKRCFHAFFRQYIEGWNSPQPSIHLHAGKCFARGLEAARVAHYDQGLSPVDAVATGAQALMHEWGDYEAPADSTKSLERTLGALEYYFDQYPLASDSCRPITLPSGKLGVEITFAEPLPVLHPETGNPLLYCGRLDMAAEFAQGFFVEDDKTTSSLGASWAGQWDLRGQFTGYCWGMRQSLGRTPNGVIVRGLSILKTKYDTQQAITYRSEAQINEWFEGTCDLAEDLVRAWKRQYWRKALDHACSDWGGCQFKQPCMVTDPQPWLETNFVQRWWNPVTQVETFKGEHR